MTEKTVRRPQEKNFFNGYCQDTVYPFSPQQSKWSFWPSPTPLKTSYDCLSLKYEYPADIYML